jgi:glycosyltransferase involved in cell wall biosynthesis
MADGIKRRVAIVHGQLGSGNGGSEARAMWAAEALKRDCVVSLVTVGPIDLTQLNLFYGTTIGPQDVNLHSLPMPRLLAGKRAPSALRGAFGRRALKYFVHDHDILISTYNLCDFGMPGIQCVADFSWDEDLRRRFDPPPGGVHNLFHRSRALRRCYLRLCKTIAPPSGRDLFAGDDLIVANSHWTATKLWERYGAIARVVYPPVAGEFPDVFHEYRYDDFVCIGRISAEKRIERMVHIIGAVRRLGHDVRIRIIGPIDSSPYSKTIVALAGQHRDWVLLEGRKVGAEKTRILAACRYGIHGREGEAFGIGVAEMAKAGCITFAPAEGGPAEIVKHDALLYRNDDEAVAKITAVLDQKALRGELIRHLRSQAKQFAPEAFMAGLREAVNDFLHPASSVAASLPRRGNAKAC